MKVLFITQIAIVLFFGCVSPVLASGKKEQSPVQNTPPVQTKQVEHSLNDTLQKMHTQINAAVESGSVKDILHIYEAFLKTIDETKPATENQIKTVQEIESVYTNFLNTILIVKKNAPPETVKNVPFKSAFIVTFTQKNTNKPLENIPVIVMYPKKEDGKIDFVSETLFTDNLGTIEFKPPVPENALNSKITFSLQTQKNTQTIELSLPYLVSTDIKTETGSIAIVDFDKNNKAVSNSPTSSMLLSALVRNSGFSVNKLGNSDFTGAVISDNPQTIQKDASALFGNRVTFLVYGTVKFTLTADDGKTTAAMTGNFKVRNIIKNTQIFSSVITANATENSETAAINAARQKITQTLAEELKYGL